MAKKTKSRTSHDCVKQAMALAAERGWAQVGLADIEGAAEYFQDKTDILVAFGRMIDAQVLEGFAGFDPDIPCRDQLFDIMMERFEALNVYRTGLVSVLDSLTLEPAQAMISMPHLCHSMSRMLAAVEIETTGIPGAVKVAGLTGVYLKVLRVWKHDDSPDLAKVMAALDKSLGHAEQIVNFMGL